MNDFSSEEMRVAAYQADREALLESFRATIDAGRRAVQGSLFINGGAGVALMTFLGHAYNTNSSSITLSFALLALGTFGTGALFATIASGLAYFSQGKHTDAFLDSLNEIGKSKAATIARRWDVASVISISLSYVLFSVGLTLCGFALY